MDNSTQAKEKTITYHSRRIEANEIAHIIALSKPREQAFYMVMTQSGLTPKMLQKLQLKDIEDLNNKQTSYKINVPQEKRKNKLQEHPRFIGEEAAKYLKLYLATRTNLTPNSLLFTTHSKPNTPINIKNISRRFQHTARKLQETGQIHYEIRQGKPSELRLYTLIKFFKQKSKDVEDESHIPQDPESYRKRYEKNALPYLKIESPTPIETYQLRQQYQQEIEKRDKQIKELQQRLTKIERAMTPLERLYIELSGAIPESERVFSELREVTAQRKQKRKKSIITDNSKPDPKPSHEQDKS